MKSFLKSLATMNRVAAIILVSLVTGTAHAAAIMNLKGNALDARYESDAEVRISLIGWSAPAGMEAVEAAYRTYQADQDLDAFLAALEEQETRGYLFTAAATGYRIKYAWQSRDGDSQMMHFLVTPGLKTRNPYLWSTPNTGETAFSLIQVAMDGETGIARTSLAGEIGVNGDGNLVLENFDALDAFATLEDDTPYYLK